MPLTPLQKRDLWLVTFFRGFSFLGDSIALITLYLRVSEHGHGWMIAALSIAAALPLVLLAPVAGYVVDKVPARTLLSCLCVVEGLVCAGIGFWHGDAVTITLMGLLTCSVAFSMPGYTALIPTLSGEENIATGQSMTAAAQNVAITAGPALGGILVGALGQSWPLYIDAITFGLAAIGTAFLRTDRVPTTHDDEVKEKGAMSAGIRLVFADRYLRPVVITMTVFMLSLGAINVAEVFFITHTLHGSSYTYGLVGASFGAGAIIGSLLARKLSQLPQRLAITSLASIAFIGALIGVVGLMEHVGYVFPLMFIAGIMVGLINVAVNTLFAIQTPEHLRGRAFAAIGAVLTSAEIGSMVLGGLLLTVISPRTVFQVAGIFAAFAVTITAPLALRASHRTHTLLEAQGD